MIITDRFVFIHMHKTGGQTLNDLIQRCIEDHKVVGYHFPRAEIPAEATTLPVVGIVRNPWDWYVSWYAFNRRPKIRNQLFNVVSDSGQGNFKSTITNLINLGSDSPASKMYRDDLIRILPDSLEGNRAAGLTKDNIRNFSDNELGYCSWLCEHMLGDINDDHTLIGKFESLQDDFLSIMKQLSVDEIDVLETELEKPERKNFSQHSHYSHYFEDDLRDLVATKERQLIDQFDYNFDSAKPPGVSYEFPTDMYAANGKGFQKLLGRESNFLQLHSGFDVDAIKAKIEALPSATWLESEREKLFAVHKDTQSVILVLFEDFKHQEPEYLHPYFDLEKELRPLIDNVARFYQNNGFVVRVLLAKLLAGGKIPHHTDAGYSLLNCHRVHIPIITNDQVMFTVGGEELNMQVGEFWEINNGIDHAVENRSDEDRIHIIIDWFPNFAGLPVEQVLVSDQAGKSESSGAPEETLMTMVALGHKLQQAGKIPQAESQYRQVLHADSTHVIANNLMGLLCLQTKRFAEAATYIEQALVENPSDAQAHANLALALKELGRAEDAEKHFHESLKLDPNNARVYNNLGGVYVEQGRIEDGIRCYQTALALQPAGAELHFNLGNALMHLRRYAEAAESLQQCLVLKPDFVDCQTKLVQALRAAQEQAIAAGRKYQPNG